jgi:hypothetical protein
LAGADLAGGDLAEEDLGAAEIPFGASAGAGAVPAVSAEGGVYG